MKFDLSALKAYMGGLVATAGPAVSAFIIGAFEKATAFDLPVSIEGFILTGVTFVLGYVGVYFTSNSLGKTA